MQLKENIVEIVGPLKSYNDIVYRTMGCGASSENSDSEEDVKTHQKGTLFVNKNANNFPSVEPLHVDDMALANYLQLEREIAEAEVKNPLKPMDLKADQLLQLNDQIDQLQEKLQQLERETVSSANKHHDEVETHQFFVDNGIPNELNEEQEQYLELLNNKEITSKELKTAKKQRKEVTKEIEQLEKRCQYLQGLYKKQDELLGGIFGGQYGSLRENQLEQELDHLEGQRSRILEANFKWRQGLMMLEYACKQLAVAVQKWHDLPTIPTIDLEIRYNIAADTRNNIVAAGQNISGAQRYLDKVDFPYCNPNEVDTLNKAAQYIFTDMQSPERHEYAEDCYVTTQKRANALLQWFDTVINTTIMKDLHEINEKVKEKTLELRRERVRLIKKKIQDLYGREPLLDDTLRGRDVGADELAQANMSDNQVVKLDNLEDINNGWDEVSLRPMSSLYENEDYGVTPLSTDELAPVPSNSVIFGSLYENYENQLDMLQKQHKEELQTFIKEQEMNQRKIKGNLEQKLMQRRQRRARMNVETFQQQELAQ